MIWIYERDPVELHELVPTVTNVPTATASVDGQ